MASSRYEGASCDASHPVGVAEADVRQVTKLRHPHVDLEDDFAQISVLQTRSGKSRSCMGWSGNGRNRTTLQLLINHRPTKHMATPSTLVHESVSPYSA